MGKKTSVPTMKDVAATAGVSLGTVSKVVNGIPVGEEYQKKVEAAIKKLDYKVNSYAQGLKTSKTNTIAFLVPDTVTPYYGHLTYHMNCALAKKGYKMLLLATNADTQMEQSYINLAAQNKVDGIICLSYNENLQVPAGTPVVSIDRHIGGDVPCVSSDNFGGGQLAASILRERGCKHLAFLSSGSTLSNETTKRGDGFVSYCVKNDIPYDVVKLHDDEDVLGIFKSFIEKHVKNGKSDIDGIFCVTDYYAIKVKELLEQHNIKVPEDVQLIGFDGIKDFISENYLCSTIVQPLEKIAEVSADMVTSNELSASQSLVCLPVAYAEGGTTQVPQAQ